MKVVGKQTVIKVLEREAGVDKSLGSFIYDLLMDTMREGLLEDKKVLLHGIGDIYLLPVTKTKRSNMTGIMIPPHKRLKFRPNFKLARVIRVKTRERPIEIKKYERN